MPVEALARRGREALAFGPLRPVVWAASRRRRPATRSRMLVSSPTYRTCSPSGSGTRLPGRETGRRTASPSRRFRAVRAVRWSSRDRAAARRCRARRAIRAAGGSRPTAGSTPRARLRSSGASHRPQDRAATERIISRHPGGSRGCLVGRRQGERHRDDRVIRSRATASGTQRLARIANLGCRTTGPAGENPWRACVRSARAPRSRLRTFARPGPVHLLGRSSAPLRPDLLRRGAEGERASTQVAQGLLLQLRRPLRCQGTAGA